MIPTEVLVKEHVSIRQMLKVLERVCGKLDTGDTVPREHLDQIVEFIRVFADQNHHGKEEAVLFPAMEKVGIPREGGPIGVMLAEHATGRQFVKELADAVERYGRGDRTAVEPLTKSARRYIGLLDAHIEKENIVLFPMAESHLPDRQKSELLAGFDRVDRESIGKEKHEHLQGILHTLSAAYLS